MATNDKRATENGAAGEAPKAAKTAVACAKFQRKLRKPGSHESTEYATVAQGDMLWLTADPVPLLLWSRKSAANGEVRTRRVPLANVDFMEFPGD